MSPLHCIEICAGAGGQALGLEGANFEPEALVEIDLPSRKTLKHNRPAWNVIEGEASDIHNFSASAYKHIDLLAGGVPCPPFSRAGKQLGQGDERDLFPEALRLIDECRPKMVMLENVSGFLDKAFDNYRALLKSQLTKLGYEADWSLLKASDYGVSQLRPRVVIVAWQKSRGYNFKWPQANPVSPPSVGELLSRDMAANGWSGATHWAAKANAIAPTIVGGSKKHGGPDLGPTRARQAWAALGVDGRGIACEAPEKNFVGMPRLTVQMVARIQGFPADWQFIGKKTPAYRQVGNAFPPPVAATVASQINAALTKTRSFSLVS